MRHAVIFWMVDGMGHQQLLDSPYRRIVEEWRIAPLKSTFPSISIPAQVGFFSGLPANQHGVFAKGHQHLLSRQPWSVAQRHMFEISHWPELRRRWPGLTFNSRIGHSRSVWTDAPVIENIQSQKITDILNAAPDQFAFFEYHSSLDSIGHRHGPQGTVTLEQLNTELQKIREFQAAAMDSPRGWDRVDLILISDHGMAPIELAFPAIEFERGDVIQKRSFALALNQNGRRQIESYIEQHYADNDYSLELIDHPMTNVQAVFALEEGHIFDRRPTSPLIGWGNHGYHPNKGIHMAGVFAHLALEQKQWTPITPDRPGIAIYDMIAYLDEVLDPLGAIKASG